MTLKGTEKFKSFEIIFEGVSLVLLCYCHLTTASSKKNILGDLIKGN